MGGKIKYYMDILGIEDIEDITHENIRKCYHKKALNSHPDKCNNGGTNEKFIELTNAKIMLTDFLSATKYKNTRTDNYEEDNIWKWVGEVLNTKENNKINEAFRKIVGDVTVKLFDRVGNDMMIEMYEIFVKYKDFLCIEETTLNELRNKISLTTKVIILNPSIDDLLNDNVFRYNYKEEIINIPLWHSELYYDIDGGDLIARCIPILGEDIWISSNNDIHKCIDIKISQKDDGEIEWDNSVEVKIGNKLFNIFYKDLKLIKNQTIRFKKEGVARINTSDMYSVEERSDIVIHVRIRFTNVTN
jgi:hypothetical protein